MSKDTEFLGPSNISFTYQKYVLNCSGQTFPLGCSLVLCASVEWGAGAHVDLWARTMPASVEDLRALLRPLKDKMVKVSSSSTSVSHFIDNVNVVSEHWSPTWRLRWTGLGVVGAGWSPSFFLLQGKVTCWKILWVDLACDLQLLGPGKLLCFLALMVSCLFSRASERKPTSR